jgi:hypothetical protein
VRRALPAGGARVSGPFIDLLERRLLALEAIALGRAQTLVGEVAADHARARRFLAPLEGTWHDGDENLVRGFLDRWQGPGEDGGVARARGLLHAAGELAGISPRPETLWFFLWEMESVLHDLAPGTGPRARIRAVRKRTPWRS